MKEMLILLSFFVVFLATTSYAFADNLFANSAFSTDLSNWDIGELPSDVSGLQLWLKADNISNTNDGSAISNWSDLSGNQYNASQSAVSLQPIYKTSVINNKPVVRFSGTSYMQLPPASLGLSNNVNGITTFTVASSKTTANARLVAIQTQAGTDRATMGRTSSGAFNALGRALDNDAVQIATGGAYSTNTFYVTDGVFDYFDGLLSVYKNGAIATSSSAFQSSSNTSSTNSKNIFIGTDGTTGFNGDMAETIIYNNTLSSSDRANIETYLANRYGLSVSGNLISATRDITRKYNNNPSAKIVTTGVANFTQTITTGDNNSYNLSMYVYTNGNPVTTSDLQIFSGGSLQTTSISSVGQGWYMVSGDVTGSTNPSDYGVQIQANKTVYLSFMTLSIIGQSSVDLGGDPDPNWLPGWKYPITAGPNFAGDEGYISNGLVPGISAYIASTAPHDDLSITFSKSDSRAFYSVGGKILPPPQLQGFHVVSDLYGILAKAAFNGYPEPTTDDSYTLLLNFYSDRIPPGHSASDLVMIELNPDTNEWEKLDTPNVADVVHSTIANTTTDFGYFAVAIPDYFPTKVLGVANNASNSLQKSETTPIIPSKPTFPTKKSLPIPSNLPLPSKSIKKQYCFLVWCL